MKSLAPVAFLSLFTLCLIGCGTQAPEGPLSVSKVVVALKPDKNPDAMIEEKSALASFLSGSLGVPVEVIIPLSGAVIEEGLANGTIDLAYVSGGTMLQVADRQAATVLLAGEIEGKTTYASYWVARRDAPYTSVADLKGKRVAFSSKTSTSGYLIPHWDLIQQGLLPAHGDPELFFGKGNVWYGSGYVSAVERVLSGEAEAAAVSYYVLDKDKHLTEEQRAQLKKIDEQGPVPTHALAVRSTLPPKDQDALRAALEALNDPAHQELRDKVFTSKLVRVDGEAHVAPLREATRLTAPTP
jgi:phosphonate transport system substrate-binding protein